MRLCIMRNTECRTTVQPHDRITPKNNITAPETLYKYMKWTDRIHHVKIILVAAAVLIAVASLVVSDSLARYP